MNNEDILQVENNVENSTDDNVETDTIEIENKINSNEESSLSNEVDTETLTIEDFNTIDTLQGEVKLNEIILVEMKTTNLYLNLILIAMVLCFLYLVISKALKKLFYINIF